MLSAHAFQILRKSKNYSSKHIEFLIIWPCFFYFPIKYLPTPKVTPVASIQNSTQSFENFQMKKMLHIWSLYKQKKELRISIFCEGKSETSSLKRPTGIWQILGLENIGNAICKVDI
jgi:hypothetical protein